MKGMFKKDERKTKGPLLDTRTTPEITLMQSDTASPPSFMPLIKGGKRKASLQANMKLR